MVFHLGNLQKFFSDCAGLYHISWNGKNTQTRDYAESELEKIIIRFKDYVENHPEMEQLISSESISAYLELSEQRCFERDLRSKIGDLLLMIHEA